jgi:hypothetical protein
MEWLQMIRSVIQSSKLGDYKANATRAVALLMDRSKKVADFHPDECTKRAKWKKRMSPILLSTNDFITTWGLTYVGDNDEKIKGEKKDDKNQVDGLLFRLISSCIAWKSRAFQIQ